MTILERIVADKLAEVAARQAQTSLKELELSGAKRTDFRDFHGALTQPGVQIIAEIKRASPSKGDLDLNLDPAKLAQQYEAGGAAALSVLTEGKYFRGSDQDLQAARQATNIPVLRKDFILTPYQAYEALALGADAILLIVRILSDEQLEELHQLAINLGLGVLVEVHDEADLQRTLSLKPQLIGINNRDLSSFHTDINVAMRVAQQVQNGLPIALSGISSLDDAAANLRQGLRHFLVGEALVKAKNSTDFLRQLRALPED
ncbi:MAG: indole-3-glycerol phosphate synthase TrpC [Fibrobacter sp.]|nr:indole-3-glycerol phosphate synthase TrpC [Fibrobacter sp.]